MEPVTLTAGAIATLAFQSFLDAGAGKLAEKFTEAAIAKMGDLREKIWKKLSGRPRVAQVKALVEQKDKITQEQINQLTAYLQVAMDEDPNFDKDIRAIAYEISLMQIEDSSSMTQINYGGTNYQTKTGIDNTNFIGGTHYHGQH